MAIIPAAATNESVRVDFPAGTKHLQLTHVVLMLTNAISPAGPTVVNVSNNTHVTNVLGQVHKQTDLLDSKLDHGA